MINPRYCKNGDRLRTNIGELVLFVGPDPLHYDRAVVMNNGVPVVYYAHALTKEKLYEQRR